MGAYAQVCKIQKSQTRPEGQRLHVYDPRRLSGGSHPQVSDLHEWSCDGPQLDSGA